jgi:hypothetical protein
MPRKKQNFVGLFLVCCANLGHFPPSSFLLPPSSFLLHLGKRRPHQVVAVWLGGVRGEKGIYEDDEASALGR